jgi:hypothetical protein
MNIMGAVGDYRNSDKTKIFGLPNYPGFLLFLLTRLTRHMIYKHVRMSFGCLLVNDIGLLIATFQSFVTIPDSPCHWQPSRHVAFLFTNATMNCCHSPTHSSLSSNNSTNDSKAKAIRHVAQKDSE